MFVIPLDAGVNQQLFDVKLGDNFITFRLRWRELINQWSCDLLREGQLLAAGIMLTPGVLLTKTNNLDLGDLIMTGEHPTLDNLGIDNKLIWIKFKQ